MAKVLIVEDNSLVSMLLKVDMDKRDYEVLQIQTTGEGAVKEAYISKPDLVFMDIILNGQMNGFEAASIIDSNVGCPIIFMSTLGIDILHKDIEKRKIQAYAVFQKPIDSKQLHEALDRFDEDISNKTDSERTDSR